MKHLLLTTIAAVVLVGCATTQSPEPPTARVLDVPILAAAYNGNIATVKQHLAAGTDVDVKGGFADGTSLHYATANGHKEIAELLIAKGANVNVKDDAGETPLDWADGETADLLRKHGGKTGAELKAEGK
jgi:ankyrin repeat protein